MTRAASERGRSRLATVNQWAHDVLSWRRRRFPRAVILLAGIGLIILLGPVAQWATPVSGLRGKELADAINSTRQVLLAAAGGLVVVVGLVFTGRTYYLTRRGQLTDRYATAINQLASDKTTERLGGIYALEHILWASEDDQETIVEVLAAFIREHVPAADDTEETEVVLPTIEDSSQRPRWIQRPPTDVRAALTVLNRRPQRIEQHLIHLERADLRGAEFPKAQLPGADMRGTVLHLAWLAGANMEFANLEGAQLSAYLLDTQLHNANLQDADMRGAQLHRADLRETWLMRANLRGASLIDAQLQGANLSNANLQDALLDRAQLHGANLADVRGLTTAQLAAATFDDTTQLPPGLRGGDTEPSAADPTTTGAGTEGK